MILSSILQKKSSGCTLVGNFPTLRYQDLSIGRCPQQTLPGYPAVGRKDKMVGEVVWYGKRANKEQESIRVLQALNSKRASVLPTSWGGSLLLGNRGSTSCGVRILSLPNNHFAHFWSKDKSMHVKWHKAMQCRPGFMALHCQTLMEYRIHWQEEYLPGFQAF